MKLLLKVFVVLSILVFDFVKSDDAEILYRRVLIDIKEKIYDDTYTGSYHDVSIWRPATLQSGYYALGDVAVPTHEKPTSSSVMVKDISGDGLKPPTGFTEVWNDKGSGGIQDVRIMSMTPPSGYVCLGHVAVIGYNNVPDKNLYRCVKEKYVTKGKYEFIWKDEGSLAYQDVSLWSNRISESDTYGIDGNTFTSFSSHGSATGSPDLLDGRTVINDIDYIDIKRLPLTVYEIPDVEEVYNDAGTGASTSISVWRSKGPAGSFSLGDIAIPAHADLEVGYVVKPYNETTFSVPYDFQQIWSDAGSQGDWEGTFWKPFCKPGFRALGHVAIRNQTTTPDARSIRCINATYTVPGKWEFVWNDAGSGAYKDVSVYTAAAKDEGGQALRAMTSFKGHGDPDTTPYVLNASETNYIQGPPATKYVLRDINYHLNDYKVLDKQPSSINRITVVNKDGRSPATTIKTLKEEYKEKYSWSNKAGGEFGVDLKLTAGIPFIAQNEVTVSAKLSYSHEWGGHKTETFSDSVRVKVTVQPCSTKGVEASGFRYQMDVPYDATLVTYYADGTQGVRDNYEGVFRGVQVNEVNVVYEPDIPIPGCELETES